VPSKLPETLIQFHNPSERTLNTKPSLCWAVYCPQVQTGYFLVYLSCNHHPWPLLSQHFHKPRENYLTPQERSLSLGTTLGTHCSRKEAFMPPKHPLSESAGFHFCHKHDKNVSKNHNISGHTLFLRGTHCRIF
jgi:hypothetical protein